MSEKPKPEQEFNGPEIYRHEHGTNIEGIPSDDGSLITLSFSQEGTGDNYLQLIDPTFETFLYPMRFRTNGGLETIGVELSLIPEGFLMNQGGIPANKDRFKHPFASYPFYGGTITIGTTPDEPRIAVIGIPDADDDFPPSRFIDIEVAQNGNVTLTQREEPDGDVREEAQQLQMTFYTQENGGQFPVMAAVFTNLAERILEAREQ
jgi:hypothetical protein